MKMYCTLLNFQGLKSTIARLDFLSIVLLTNKKIKYSHDACIIHIPGAINTPKCDFKSRIYLSKLQSLNSWKCQMNRLCWLLQYWASITWPDILAGFCVTKNKESWPLTRQNVTSQMHVQKVSSKFQRFTKLSSTSTDFTFYRRLPCYFWSGLPICWKPGGTSHFHCTFQPGLCKMTWRLQSVSEEQSSLVISHLSGNDPVAALTDEHEMTVALMEHVKSLLWPTVAHFLKMWGDEYRLNMDSQLCYFTG